MKVLSSLLLTLVLASVCYAAAQEKSLSEIRLEDYYAAKPELTIPTQEEAIRDPLQEEFGQSFASLQLRKSNLNLDRWFREDQFIYFADYMTADEKKEMIKIVGELQKRIQAGGKNLDRLLIGAGPAFVIAKAGKLDREVLRFKDQHKDVFRFAISKHEA